MRIGVLGGGQLSKMLALSGLSMGFDFLFYFPETEHSLHDIGKIINGSYDDYHLLNQFAQQVDVITYENENIPLATIRHLMKISPVFPDHHALFVSQDRLNEKEFFASLGIPTNQFMAVHNLSDAVYAGKKLSYPFLLKKRKFGYDGKGQFLIKNEDELKKMSMTLFDDTIAEEYVNFDREVSFIITKNAIDTVHYDICENKHSKGILLKTKNVREDPVTDLAFYYTKRIADKLNYRGTLTIEFFQVGNNLLANEMAPRVHNSGHWTIDACITSQFDNHLRAILNLPLGSTTSLAEVTMFNILEKMPDKDKLFRISGLNVHYYNKKPKKGRKLGHVTIFHNTLSESDFLNMIK